MKSSTLTNLIPLKFSHFSMTGLLFVLNISSAIPADAPGILAQEPLQTSATAEPNIVFLLDNSSSMVTNSIGGVTRLQVLKNVLHDIVPELNGVRVGMFTFDNGNGTKMLDSNSAKVMRLLDKSDGSYTTTLDYFINTSTGTIDALSSGSGGTILAESLQDIGRYYANDTSAQCGGSTTAELKIHPDDNLPGDTPPGLQENVSCTALLGDKTEIKNLAEATIYSCQKNFAIVMTDGETKSDTGLRSDALTYTNTVAADGITEYIDTSKPEHPFRDYDQDCTSTAQTAGDYLCDTNNPRYDRKEGGTNKNYIYNAIADGGTDFLDDVAQALYEIDLRPDYSSFKNNVTTFTIGFGEAILDPGSGTYNPLMESAAAQAGGEYFFANDAASLLSSFQSVVSSIIGQTSTSSAVTFNSSTLSSQSAVYQALFNTSSWSGQLNSFPIDGITGAIHSNCTQGTDNCWQAAEQLDAQTPSERFIIVAGDNSLKHGVEFKYVHGTDDYANLNSSDIPWALVADLCSTAVGTVSGTSFPCLTSDVATKTANSIYIEDLMNYLRGDNSQEGSSSNRKFRIRLHDLGDIVNSSPVYVGEPQQNWPRTGLFPNESADTTPIDISYSAWKYSSIKNRPGIVYVASNDGILHGFRAKAFTDISEDVNTSAGEEVFAFIPTGTFSTENSNGLHFLADNNYTHRFYNDLPPTIADVYMDYRTSGGGTTGTFNLATTAKDTTTADWRTVLLGGQGGGGKSLYLLDITDPLEYTDNAKQDPTKLLLWEFTHNDLGYSYSKPTIAMMNNGKFAAIFGNGYNSATCKAQLFIVFLEGGLDGVWTEDTDYFVYDTGAGGAGDCNGLSTPAVVDLNKDGTADRVYAGDLKGNLWVFDLCNYSSGCPTTPTSWGIANALPLMYANDGVNRQPITSKPAVSIDPSGDNSDDLIIVFGTGQYLTNIDKGTTGLQRMYGVRDYGALTNSTAGHTDNWNIDGDNDSPPRWAITTFAIDTGTGARTFATTDAIADTDHGWRIDLTDPGERMVVNPKIRNNIVFFNTLIPNDVKCSYGGAGWIMSVNLSNGGFPPFPVFDVNGDGFIDENDIIAAGQKLNEIPAESTFLGDNQYTPGSDGTINVRKVNVGESRREGRMSWKEIYEAQ